MFLALRCTTFEIVSAYCLDREVGAIDYPEFEHPFITGIQSAIPFFWVLKYLPWLTPMMADPSDWVISKMPKLRAVFEFRFDIRRDIDNILDNPDVLQKAEHPTVYQHLLAVPEEKGANRELTREEMVQEAINLLSAGSDTVGNITYVGVFHVLNNKEILERLTSELRTVWPDPGAHVNYTVLEKLPYLVRCFPWLYIVRLRCE
jgi:cytochrome P450